MILAEFIVWVFAAYVFAGMVFAVWFAAFGAALLDPVAGKSGFGLRLVLVPGALALWPYLLIRVIFAPGKPQERNAHRRAVASSQKGR